MYYQKMMQTNRLFAVVRLGLASRALASSTTFKRSLSKHEAHEHPHKVENQTVAQPAKEGSHLRETPMSFIERAKVSGANALLGQLTHKDGFDTCVSGLRIDRITSGTVLCSIEVKPNLQNSYGTLHGGAIAVLVDVVGTLALLSMDVARAGVSVDINVTYMAAAKANDVVEVEGRVLKFGNKIAFTQIDFRRKSDGTLLATGRHTKAV